MKSKVAGWYDRVLEAKDSVQRSSNKNPYSVMADGPTDGYVDPKPYWEVDADARFFSYQGERWTYYKFPENVDVGRDSSDPVQAQQFLNEVFRGLSQHLGHQTEQDALKMTRQFHMAMIRDVKHQATRVDGATPLSLDYETRMEQQLRRETWHGYFGVENIEESQTLEQRWSPEAIRDRFFDKEKAIRDTFARDERLVDSIVTGGRYGRFTPLDFDSPSGMRAYEHLTAWHGIKDEDFYSPRALANTKMIVPNHGYSVFTERWGEIEFLAVGPEDKDALLKVDPYSNVVRWADTLFRPGQDVIGVWVRGHILSEEAAKVIIDGKYSRANQELNSLRSDLAEQESQKRGVNQISQTEVDDAGFRQQRTALAQQSTHYGAPLLDCVEILVAVRVRPPMLNGTPLEDSAEDLARKLKSHRLTARPLRGRNKLAMQSTFPGSPVRLNKRPKHNRFRSELHNSFLPGVLSMSGIMRSSSPASPTGPVVGWEDSPEMATVRADITDPANLGGAPGFLVSGQPGAGKALALDTRVMTPYGVTTIKALRPGDTVLDIEGNPTRVVFVSDTMTGRDVYQIRLSDGQVLYADAEHQWPILSADDEDGLVNSDVSVLELMGLESGLWELWSRLYDSGSLGHPLSAQEMFDLISSEVADGRRMPWRTPDALVAAVDFGGFGTQDTDPIYRANGEREFIMWHAIHALSNRIRQIMPGRATRGLARATTKELVEGDRFRDIRLARQPVIPGKKRSLPTTARQYGVALGLAAAQTEGLGLDAVVTDQARETIGPDTAPEEFLSWAREQYSDLSGVSPCLYTSDVQDRLDFVAGYLSVRGFATDSGFVFTDLWSEARPGEREDNGTEVLESVAYITRGLGLCSRETDGQVIEVYVSEDRQDVLAAIPGVGAKGMYRHLRIESIDPVESEPVRCIGVEHESRAFLIAGNVVTSNTMFMLQFGAQTANFGKRWIFLNPPKTEVSSLAPFFTHPKIGGLVIRMSRGVLESQPGMTDPFIFVANTPPPLGDSGASRDREMQEKLREQYTQERGTIANMLSSALERTLSISMEESSDMAAKSRHMAWRREIASRARSPYAHCLGDVIFGNRVSGDPGEGPLSDPELVQVIRDLMAGSPFWGSFISTEPISQETSEIRRAISGARDDDRVGPRPVLIEWDSTMRAPSSGSGAKNADEIDAILNIETMYQYAVRLVTLGGEGGLITFDEAHLLNGSPEIMQMLDAQVRLLREGNATTMFGSQSLPDMDGSRQGRGGYDLLSFMGRTLALDMGESASEEEWEVFERQMGVKADAAMRRYMTSAAMKHNPRRIAPLGYYSDTFHRFKSRMIIGPFPEVEVNAARTDPEGQRQREAKAVARSIAGKA